jgi:hypothetical protein
MICCIVSVSFLQNLQVRSPSNRPMVYRCPLTGACPVRIATKISSYIKMEVLYDVIYIKKGV